MSWQFTKNIITGEPEIIISGFENGIADSPYEGIADIRNMDILTAPKQANVNFATAGVVLPPSGYTGVAFTSVATTDIFTTATTAGFYNGMALLCVTIAGAGSAIAGTTYYVGNITGTTFKLYTDISCNTLLDVTVDKAGTFSVQTFGTPSDSFSGGNAAFASDSGLAFKYTFIMTADGLVWYLTYLAQPFSLSGTIAINTLQFLGNTGHSAAGSTNQTGIAIWQGYLFAFMNAKIDYIAVSNITGANPSASWQYGWKNITSSAQGHRAIPATDNDLYFCNLNNVGSLIQNTGSTFDPTSSSTYTYNVSALTLPAFDIATCLAQLGTTLLTGGILNFVYPWNRVSTSFDYPLIVAENYTKCIVSTNSSAYIFAGNRGYIYITNGANIQVFKKLPDSLSGTVSPYYNWGWAVYWKDQLFFTVSATANSFATTISNFAGIWVYNLINETLRMSNSLSYGTYAGTVPVLVPMGHTIPTGDGLYAGWLNGTGGIDFTSASPYTNFEPRIDTDIIPIGTFLNANTFSNLEYKVAKPLVSGESVRISQRSNLTSAFVDIPVTEGGQTGDISGICTPLNFENVQWIQFRIESSSTASTPSYVPLTEIRLRK